MMRATAMLALGAALLPCPALADEPDEAWKPPVLTTERYNEDWSNLADPANRTGHWTEKFKYIPLDGTGAVYLTTGAEARLRYEDYQGNGWGGAAAPDDGYLWTRVMPYADLHVGKVRAFVQPVAAYAAGVAPSPSPVDQTRVDLLQAFADVETDLGDGASLRLRAGRELIGLGTERLVGTRYGPNVQQPFDGGRAILHRGALTANLFYLRPVEAGPGSFDDRTSHNRTLWGLYATQMFGPAGAMGIDLYYLGYRNETARFQQGTGDEQRHTIGARFFGSASGMHWNVEGMAQFGRFAGMPIRAWSVASEMGHVLPRLPLKPDAFLRFNMASGDASAKDHRLGTFNALFPKGKYFGELSPLGPYNLVNLQPGVTLDLGSGVSLSLAGALYWRESRGDGIYDVPGHLLRAGAAGNSRFIGREGEAKLQWRATKELTLSGSLSAFQPGGFIRETGPARTIRLIGLESNYRF